MIAVGRGRAVRRLVLRRAPAARPAVAHPLDQGRPGRVRRPWPASSTTSTWWSPCTATAGRALDHPAAGRAATAPWPSTSAATCGPRCPPTTSPPTSTASRPRCAACTPSNPVNLPPGGGVQLELPPRVRGTSPLWWDWEGPGLTPHTEPLVEGLAAAAGPGPPDRRLAPLVPLDRSRHPIRRSPTLPVRQRKRARRSDAQRRAEGSASDEAHGLEAEAQRTTSPPALRPEPLDHPRGVGGAGSGSGRAAGSAGPARTRARRARPAATPVRWSRHLGTGEAGADGLDGARPSSARFDEDRASATTPRRRAGWPSAGRRSRRRPVGGHPRGSTGPRTRTWRWSSSQPKVSAAPGVGGQLGCLGRREVREERRSRARRRRGRSTKRASGRPVGVDRGQHHGVRLGALGGDGVVVPALPLARSGRGRGRPRRSRRSRTRCGDQRWSCSEPAPPKAAPVENVTRDGHGGRSNRSGRATTPSPKASVARPCRHVLNCSP